MNTGFGADFRYAMWNSGAAASSLADAISEFVSKLNKEYLDEDPPEEMSFDELMRFGEEDV